MSRLPRDTEGAGNIRNRERSIARRNRDRASTGQMRSPVILRAPPIRSAASAISPISSMASTCHPGTGVLRGRSMI
jgi:hypothetical protein